MSLTLVKGRKKTSRESYSLVSNGKTLLNTCYLHVAESAVEVFFQDLRSVSIKANHLKGKTIGHYIYGRRQGGPK